MGLKLVAHLSLHDACLLMSVCKCVSSICLPSLCYRSVGNALWVSWINDQKVQNFSKSSSLLLFRFFPLSDAHRRLNLRRQFLHISFVLRNVIIFPMYSAL
eukprot:Selendium_serpulae@DN6231_c4_g1_i6.p1